MRDKTWSDSLLRVASCGRVIARGAGSADNRAEAYLNRGDAYFAMSGFDRAVLDYEQAITLSPTKPEGFIKQGDALAAGGEQAKGLENYEQAIRLDPKNANVLSPSAPSGQNLGLRKGGFLAHRSP
jgi:tetratricopeptide (TPR) repeat protein